METADAVAETAETVVEMAALSGEVVKAMVALSGEAVKAMVALENGEVAVKVDYYSEEWVALAGHNLEHDVLLWPYNSPPFGFS
jgi:hypothetical protein